MTCFELDCPPEEPLLLASVQSELWLLGVHSGSLNLLSSVNQPVFSLDYHWAQQRVYWLSPDYQSIRWADIKSNSRGTLIKGTRPVLKGVFSSTNGMRAVIWGV